MKLTDKYSIEKEAHGFSLVEKTEIKVMKDGELTGKVKDGSKKRYYGTVYQALQGFMYVAIDDSVDSNLSDIKFIVQKTLIEIINAEENIKSMFCVEVKHC